MYKARITQGQAIKVNAVATVVAKTNLNLPIELPDRNGWILYTFDRQRRKWAYYLVCRTEEQATKLLRRAEDASL